LPPGGSGQQLTTQESFPVSLWLKRYQEAYPHRVALTSGFRYCLRDGRERRIVLRAVSFARGETDESLDIAAPIVVEGELVVIRHPARGQFPAVGELQVREA
jgi:hypothetical protein